MKELDCKSIEEIQNLIINYAIIWANEINQGNHKNANKQNSNINRFVLRLKPDKIMSSKVLVPLLQHIEPSVRLFAAVHALDQGFEIEKSLQILETLAKDHSTQGISIMAYINLKKWLKESEKS